MEENKKEVNEKKVEVRHTISAEETFTLAKDVFDLRTFIKNVYANRAVILRRLNVLSLVISIIFTVLYSGYAVFVGVTSKLSFGWDIAFYSLIGVYTVLITVLIIITVKSSSATTQTIKTYNKFLKIFRYAVKVMSVIMAVMGMVISSISGASTPLQTAIDTVFLVISIVFTVIQLVFLIFGGIGGLVRWLLSPVKKKTTFSEVAVEWYGLVQGRDSKLSSVTKVNKKHVDEIGKVIDLTILPKIGKKRIQTVNSVCVYEVINSAPENYVPIVEGTFKSIFKYAEEAGYITFNPLNSMELEGSVEVKEKKTVKERFLGLLGKFGKKALNKFIDDSVEEGKKEREKTNKK